MQSFDTQRLDEECERIAPLIGNAVRADDVRNIITGNYGTYSEWFCRQVFSLCRRPKVVPA